MVILPTRRRLTGHCWHSRVDSLNKSPPHISHWAGWSVCTVKSLYPLQRLGRSHRILRSRSSRGGRSETSELLGEFDKMAARSGSKMTKFELAALEEWMTLLVALLGCTSPDSPTSLRDPVPMETTCSRQCGTETEQQHLSHSLLCLSVSSSALCLFSLLTCTKTTERHLYRVTEMLPKYHLTEQF